MWWLIQIGPPGRGRWDRSVFMFREAGATSELVETRRLELLTLSLQRRCSAD